MSSSLESSVLELLWIREWPSLHVWRCRSHAPHIVRAPKARVGVGLHSLLSRLVRCHFLRRLQTANISLFYGEFGSDRRFGSMHGDRRFRTQTRSIYE